MEHAGHSTLDSRDPDQAADQEVISQLEHGPLAMIEWDENFCVKRWSPRAEQLFGWAQEEAVGKHVLDLKLIAPIDLERISLTIQNLAAGRWHQRTEQNYNRTKSGATLYCSWYNTVTCSHSGRVTSILSLVLDETLAKKNADELARQSERLELAFSASKLGVWDWDFADNKISWDGSFAQLFGFEDWNAELTHEEFRVRIEPEDWQVLQQAIKFAVENHTDFNEEYRLRVPGVSQRWVCGQGRAVYGASGEPIRLVGTVVDVTNRKLAEEELRLSKLQAEQANELKSAFLANMSHEIRTPLGVILGFAELLADPNLQGAERKNYVDVIHRNGQHLSTLINDILDLSKVEAGKLETRIQPVDIRLIVEDVLINHKAAAKQKGVRLEAEYIGEVAPTMRTDAVRFRQILTNLVGNALKFTEAGEVRTLITQEIVGTKRLVKFIIRDTGIGISKAGQKGLFEPFVQADRSSTRRFGGTGLGLALSRRLARSLGGDIQLVNSVPGSGSVFEFTLADDLMAAPPLETAASNYPKPEEPKPSIGEVKPLRGIRLLVAEDAADSRALMDRILRKRGAEPCFAADGEEAVQLATNGHFDLILMDIQMPKLDGYGATRQLRSLGCESPIVALTAHAMSDERQRCLDAGCDDYLTKPVDPERLTRVIRESLRTLEEFKQSGPMSEETRPALEMK